MKKLGLTGYSLSKEMTQLLGRHIKPDTVYKLIEKTKYPTKDILDVLCLILDSYPDDLFYHLRKPKGVTRDTLLAFNLLNNKMTPDELLVYQEKINFLHESIRILGKQEKFVILRYFGFIFSETPWTYESIGEEMGKRFFGQTTHKAGTSFSRENVRHLIASGLRKMRRYFKEG
ncbi:MAG: hypothetical protein PHW31_04590 [Candidatus Pacebacteria bacterium]|nr:hypothetical protein [Candidatus Paceibacterota bacterium]